MTVEGRTYRKRVDAGHQLLTRMRRDAANQLGSRERPLEAGELGGFPLTLTVSRPLGEVRLRLALSGAPEAEVILDPKDLAELEPGGIVSRLENQLTRLETNRARALADADRARTEITHAQASLGKAFAQAVDLTGARDRVRQIDEQLQAATRAQSSPLDPQPEAQSFGTSAQEERPLQADGERYGIEARAAREPEREPG